MGSLIVVFILGIAFGINVAEKNMQKIQGIEGAPKAIQVTPVNGKVEIAVLGEVVQTENPIKQVNQEKVAEVKKVVEAKSSWLSQVGNTIGSGLRIMMRSLFDFVFGWFR
ncbi:Protein of unknown function [Thermoflavimicrobium dichotomicum]|uniref:DUF3679 domain-containing protein n=2 Tax=Thermoflavimicrobium dichotomicum TaxID=46223 RepID=A0A1I3NJQ4_9BACL|nr:Protein of unknown function [Thermoflavimicrobium dichotomicum]